EETVTVSCWTRACLDRTWDAWTTAAGLQQWWWPHLPDTTYEIDARDDGRYAVASVSAGVGARGKFLQVDRPHRLVMTWHWDDDHPLPNSQEDLLVSARATRVSRPHGTVAHTVGSDNGVVGYLRGWDGGRVSSAQLRSRPAVRRYAVGAGRGVAAGPACYTRSAPTICGE